MPMLSTSSSSSASASTTMAWSTEQWAMIIDEHIGFASHVWMWHSKSFALYSFFFFVSHLVIVPFPVVHFHHRLPPLSSDSFSSYFSWFFLAGIIWCTRPCTDSGIKCVIARNGHQCCHCRNSAIRLWPFRLHLIKTTQGLGRDSVEPVNTKCAKTMSAILLLGKVIWNGMDRMWRTVHSLYDVHAHGNVYGISAADESRAR